VKSATFHIQDRWVHPEKRANDRIRTDN
jgi:hypothetical protein